MLTPTSTTGLSPEQIDTVDLLDRLLGRAIADRYVDFCRLADGGMTLRVAGPLAAHALRELESMLRGILAVPLDAVIRDDPANEAKRASAQEELKKLGFDDELLKQADAALRPRTAHKEQIRRICERLNLGSSNDILHLWIGLTDGSSEAHRRSFHQSLDVNEEFRARYQRPFQTVIRAVVIALQGQYARLMSRVEELSRMAERGQAVKLFTKEIPGALPLQRHFFQHLEDGRWLPPLLAQGVLGDPLGGADEDTRALRFHEWPAGAYLIRMAASTEAATRRLVLDALAVIKSSKAPTVHRYGLEVLAALPIEEAIPFADYAVAWIESGGDYPVQQAPEALLKKLAVGGYTTATLRIAQALLDFEEQGEELASRYGSQLYESQLPEIAKMLVETCGLDGLRLLVALLGKAGREDDRLKHAHWSSSPVTDDELATYDIFSALLTAVRRCAEVLVDAKPECTSAVVALFKEQNAEIFQRFALHILARHPAAASDLATAYLLDAQLIEATWCHEEYATLARAWFPFLREEEKYKVLEIVDGSSDKYRPQWRERYLEHKGSPPGAEDERKYVSATYRDLTWRWRDVLPHDRQQSLADIVEELGDPDAWKKDAFPSEESPLTADELAEKSVFDVIEYLRSWEPGKSERQTTTALAAELRVEVGKRPSTYAEYATQFANLRSIYIRQLFDGLTVSIQNKHKIPWGNVLSLLEVVFLKLNDSYPSSTTKNGDDPSWSWVCLAGARLVATGLRLGADSIEQVFAPRVVSLVQCLAKTAPREEFPKDLEERFERDPYFAGASTLSGLVVELAVLFISWSNTDKASEIGKAPQQALKLLPEIGAVLQRALEDKALAGRASRGILGRYLSYLMYVGEQWVLESIADIFPKDDALLRRSAWLAHLMRDRGPISDLMIELGFCYSEEISLLPISRDSDNHNQRQKRLAEYLVVLHLWNGCSDDLLKEFWKNASPRLRHHAMWFVGVQTLKDSLGEAGRARAMAYWENRLSIAREAVDADVFRDELAAFGTWFGRDRIDDRWLLTQATEMFGAGFAPKNEYLVVQRLAKVSIQNPEPTIHLLLMMLHNPHVDRWAFYKKDQVRTIITAALVAKSNEAVRQAKEVISVFSSRGETSYLDLLASHH